MSAEDERGRRKRDSKMPCITHHSPELKVDVCVCVCMCVCVCLSLGMIACNISGIL